MFTLMNTIMAVYGSSSSVMRKATVFPFGIPFKTKCYPLKSTLPKITTGREKLFWIISSESYLLALHPTLSNHLLKICRHFFTHMLMELIFCLIVCLDFLLLTNFSLIFHLQDIALILSYILLLNFHI